MVIPKVTKRKLKRDLLVALAAFGLMALGFGLTLGGNSPTASTRNQASVSIPLDGLVPERDQVVIGTLSVNGPLKINGGLTLKPSARPNNPATGQTYLDRDDGTVYVYDGQNWSSLGVSGALNQLPDRVGTVEQTITQLQNSSSVSQTNFDTVTQSLRSKVDLQAANAPPQTGNIAVTGVIAAASFQGSGAGLLDIDADAIATGTLDDARLSARVAFLDVDQQFTGNIGIQAAPSANAALVLGGALQLANGTLPTASPTLNGSLFFDSTTQHFVVVENGQYKTLCNQVDGNCMGTGGGLSLQNVYDNSSSPATIVTTSTGKTFLLKAGPTANSDKLFAVQDSAGNSLLQVDSVNTRVGVNTDTPDWTLDVNGDINTGGTFRINGVAVCTTTGCAAQAGSGSYIQNGTATTQPANFNIQSSSTSNVTAVLKALAGQTADLFQAQSSTGSVLAAFDSSGSLVFAGDTNLYRTAANTLKTDDSLQVVGSITSRQSGSGQVVVGTSNTTPGIRFGTSAGPTLSSSSSSGSSGGLVVQTTTSGAPALEVKGYSGGGGNIFEATSNAGSANVFKITNSGSVISKNVTDSATAFQIQNASGSTLLNFDTTNGVTAGNLITNPSFETDTSGWTARSSATIAKSSTQSYDGSASLGITTTVAFQGADYVFALSPSTQYTVSFYVYSPGGIYNITWSDTSSRNCTSQTPASNSWTRLSCTFTTGASVTSGKVGIQTSDATGRTYYIDAVRLETGALASSYNSPAGLTVNSQEQIAVNSSTAFRVQNTSGTNLFNADTMNNILTLSGTTLVKTDSTTAFQVQSAAGTSTLMVDTTNRRVGVNNTSPQAAFQVTGVGTGDVFRAVRSDNTSIGLRIDQFGSLMSDSSGSFFGSCCNPGSTILTIGSNFSNATRPLLIKPNEGTNTRATDYFAVQNYDGTINVFRVGSSGGAFFRNTADSTTGFLIQNAAGTSLLTFDTAGNKLTLNANTQFAIGTSNITFDGNSGSAALGGVLPGDTKLFVSTGAKVNLRLNQTSTNNILELQQSGTNVLTVGSTGNTLLKNSTDSTTAFQIQNASGTSLLNFDTTTGQTSGNLITNPSFETDTSGWTTRGASISIARNTTTSFHGVASLAVTTSAGQQAAVFNVTMSPSTQYTVSMYIYTPSSGYNLQWNDTSQRSCSSVNPAVNTWTRISCTFTTGSSVGGTSQIAIQTNTGNTTAHTFYIDAVRLEAGAAASPFTTSGGLILDSQERIQVDANAAFQVQDASGTNVFVVDTVNGRVGIGTNAPESQLHVAGNILINNGNFLKIKRSDGTAVNVIGISSGASGVTFNSGTSSSSSAAYNFQNANSNSLFTLSGTGAALFQNSSNSIAALDVQNATGTSYLRVDTANGAVISNVSMQAAQGFKIITSNAQGGVVSHGAAAGTGGVSVNDVVVMDNTEGVVDTTTARDPRIYGVSMGTVTSGTYVDIALSGNYQVNADTAAVSIGDQLVTSTTAGKVTVDNNATTGILGYATTSKIAGSNGLVGVRIETRSGVSTPVFRNTADSTTAFQIQNAAGTSNLLVADTTNLKIGIGAAPSSTGSTFQVTGSASVSSSMTVNGTISAGNLSSTGQIYINSNSLTNAYFGKVYVAGAALNDNEVVVLGNVSNAARAVTTTTERDSRVLGVVTGTVNSGTSVLIATSGQYVVKIATADAVSIGDQLVASSVAGEAKVDNSATTGIVGYATANKTAGSGSTVSVMIRPSGGQSTPIFRNANDSTTAFQIQNAGGTSNLFIADTTNSRIGIGTATLSNAQLTVQNSGASTFIASFLDNSGTSRFSVTDTGTVTIGGAVNSSGVITASSGASTGRVQIGNVGPSSKAGLTFGTANDTNLYRDAADTLKTDDSFQAANVTATFSVAAGSSFNINNSGNWGSGSVRRDATVGTGGVNANDVVVVANDGANGARAMQTTTARDPKVYGVAVATVAANNPVSVVILGNVPVNVDTAAVAVGDQLVTSSTAGLATVDNNATTGIIGYAVGTKAAGSTGTVNIIVRPTSGVDSPQFRNASNSTTAFQVQNAAGTSYLNVDTANGRLNVGTGTTPTATLGVGGSLGVNSTIISNSTITARNGGIGQVKIGSSTSNPTIAFGSAGDANLYSNAASVLVTDGRFETNVGATSSVALVARVASEANAHFAIFGDGKTEWGAGGASTRDTNLYRYAAGALKTDGVLRTGSNVWVADGNAAQVYLGAVNGNAGLIFGSSSDTNLYRAAADNLKTDDKLTVQSASGVALEATSTSSKVVTVNRNTDDGMLVDFQRDGSTVGDISVAGGTVSYNAFTGSHYGTSTDQLSAGELVSLSGGYTRTQGELGEPIYNVKKTTLRNDPAVMGAYLAGPDGSRTANLIAAVGNGDIWLADTGKNLVTGDYLISSATPGHAELDTQTDPTSQVIAKIAEPVDWSTVTETVNGVKHKKVSVFFTTFARNNAVANLQADVSAISAGLNTGNFVAENLEVRGKAVIGELEVTGNITVRGDAKVEGKFRAESIEVGANNRGIDVNVEQGKKEIEFKFLNEQEDTVYGVQLTPNWVTAYAVIEKNKDGFKVKFDKSAPADAKFDWVLLR